MARAGRLPDDPSFPPYATDWLTGEIEKDMVYREGKWWTPMHWRMRGQYRQKDLWRRRRNESARAFLSNDPADPGL